MFTPDDVTGQVGSPAVDPECERLYRTPAGRLVKVVADCDPAEGAETGDLIVRLKAVHVADDGAELLTGQETALVHKASAPGFEAEVETARHDAVRAMDARLAAAAVAPTIPGLRVRTPEPPPQGDSEPAAGDVPAG